MPVPAPVITFAAQGGVARNFASSRAPSPSLPTHTPLDTARHELKRLIIALEGDGMFKILPPLAYRREARHDELSWAFEQTLGRIEQGVEDQAGTEELGRRLEAAGCSVERVPEGYEYALDVLKQYNCETFSRVMPVHPVTRIVHGLERRGVAIDGDHAVHRHDVHGWEDLHLSGRRIALVAGHEPRTLDPQGAFNGVPPVPSRLDLGDSDMWYPFLAVQDAPRPDTVMPSSGSLTAKLDLFVAMRLALKQMTALHALAGAAASRRGREVEGHTEHTRQMFGVLTYGKTWELHVMRLCGDDEVVEVRLWEGAMDRANHVVEFQSLLQRILSGAGARARTVRTWLELIAAAQRPRYGDGSRPQSEVKDEAMDGVEAARVSAER